MNNKYIMYDLFDKLVLMRFENIDTLRFKINQRLDSLLEYGNFYVKDISVKEDYTSDFQDYEIMCVVGTNEEDLYDLSIYFTKSRIGENVIVEVGYETI